LLNDGEIRGVPAALTSDGEFISGGTMDRKATLTAAALTAVAMAAGCAHMGGSSAKAETVECHGVNGCKGQSECGGPGHSCSGQNACKGQGWLSLTPTDCTGRGGTFTAKK
jgi:uncharacterized membrane protein